MVKSSTCLVAIGILFVSGCGGFVPESNLQGSAAHGGISFGFLDKKGSVEIGTEPADPKTTGVSKQNSHQVFAYFYQPDGKTAMTTPATDVKITRGELPPILLSPQDLPGKTGRFASAPGPNVDELRGVLEATIEGRHVQVPFTKR